MGVKAGEEAAIRGGGGLHLGAETGKEATASGVPLAQAGETGKVATASGVTQAPSEKAGQEATACGLPLTQAAETGKVATPSGLPLAQGAEARKVAVVQFGYPMGRGWKRGRCPVRLPQGQRLENWTLSSSATPGA